MLSALARRSSRIQSTVKEHHLEAYFECAVGLNTIWRQSGQPPRIGLAISGGVDSMALAFLCQEVAKAESGRLAPLYKSPAYPRISTSFVAFIVDHRMRCQSDVEAEQVAAELKRLGIESRVLELDWTLHGDPSQLSNMETTARALRYQAMGCACKDDGINSLLFAHHANDQHETNLSRIYSNYLGIGLRGMDFIANIPECDGIYGVDESGGNDYTTAFQGPTGRRSNRMSIESGGVKIGRPLLSLKKDELIKICKENGVKWFEDHTNTDPTLTVRNTLRHLIKDEQLPQALSEQRILALESKVSKEHHEVEITALQLFRKMPLTLDLRSGAATFTITQTLMAQSHNARKLHAMIVRKMIEVVSYKSTISLQGLDAAVDLVFDPQQANQWTKPVQNEGVEISKVTLEASNSNKRIYKFHRAIPPKILAAEEQKAIELMPGKWSDWVLWDGRYWIRVQPPERDLDPDLQIVVKFLAKQDLERLRRGLTRVETSKLNRRLQCAKGSTRFTLPAIVARRPGNDLRAETPDQVVAMPTLNWCIDGWTRDGRTPDAKSWLWDIRYKHVDLDLKGTHRVIS